MMIPLLCVLSFQSVIPPKMTGVETKAGLALRSVGGNLNWVKDGDWKLSLDINNKSKAFDFKQIETLSRLSVLRIFQGGIREESLATLSGMPRLELLVILSDGLSDKAMPLIGALKGLKKLDIKSAKLTVKGLNELKGLKSLRRLYLYNTKIKDGDLAPLMGLKQLSVLDLPPTVSSAGLKKVKQALPKTDVRIIKSEKPGH